MISNVGEVMLSWAKDLFPLCRSITGRDTLKTLEYFQKLNPEFKKVVFKTGEQVFDWNIPKEWNITDAYLEHESGVRYAEFKKSNLHVLNYSTPIQAEMDFEELEKHIYTYPEQPDWVPYITSYYKERWGFCMSENDKQKMPAGKYKVVIDTTLEPGTLNLLEARLAGQSEQEIFFSSYVCHPSMVNNELSGPVVLNALMQYIKEHYPTPRFSYRFVLQPETIGSIAYLSRNLEEMKRKVCCGFNLSCVGDERAYSQVETRWGDSLADKALTAALIGKDNLRRYSFLERASDERQYNAPGVDLPIVTFCRSKFGEYPEYHSSADNFDVVTAKGLKGAFDVMVSIIDAFEMGQYPKVNVLCEPQLGKRGLYPTLSVKGSYDSVKLRTNYLAYSDGKTSIFDIAQKIEANLSELLNEHKTLSESGLISNAPEPH